MLVKPQPRIPMRRAQDKWDNVSNFIKYLLNKHQATRKSNKNPRYTRIMRKVVETLKYLHVNFTFSLRLKQKSLWNLWADCLTLNRCDYIISFVMIMLRGISLPWVVISFELLITARYTNIKVVEKAREIQSKWCRWILFSRYVQAFNMSRQQRT